MRKFYISVSGLAATGLGCFLLALAFQGVAHAQTTFDVTILAGACSNCHGTDGRSPGGIPPLAGRPADILKAQMLAFKSESPPPGTTIMNRLAKGYSDAEIEALAKHFSTITPHAHKITRGLADGQSRQSFGRQVKTFE